MSSMLFVNPSSILVLLSGNGAKNFKQLANCLLEQEGLEGIWSIAKTCYLCDDENNDKCLCLENPNPVTLAFHELICTNEVISKDTFIESCFAFYAPSSSLYKMNVADIQYCTYSDLNTACDKSSIYHEDLLMEEYEDIRDDVISRSNLLENREILEESGPMYDSFKTLVYLAEKIGVEESEAIPMMKNLIIEMASTNDTYDAEGVADCDFEDYILYIANLTALELVENTQSVGFYSLYGIAMLLASNKDLSHSLSRVNVHFESPPAIPEIGLYDKYREESVSSQLSKFSTLMSRGLTEKNLINMRTDKGRFFTSVLFTVKMWSDMSRCMVNFVIQLPLKCLSEKASVHINLGVYAKLFTRIKFDRRGVLTIKDIVGLYNLICVRNEKADEGYKLYTTWMLLALMSLGTEINVNFKRKTPKTLKAYNLATNYQPMITKAHNETTLLSNKLLAIARNLNVVELLEECKSEKSIPNMTQVRSLAENIDEVNGNDLQIKEVENFLSQNPKIFEPSTTDDKEGTFDNG